MFSTRNFRRFASAAKIRFESAAESRIPKRPFCVQSGPSSSNESAANIKVESAVKIRTESAAKIRIPKRPLCVQSGPSSSNEFDANDWESKLSDPERRRLIEIRREYGIYRSVDFRMPTEIAPKHWIRLLKESKPRERLLYFWKLGSDERSDLQKEFERLNKRRERQDLFQRPAEPDPDPNSEPDPNPNLEPDPGHSDRYGLWKNSIFQRFNDRDMSRFYAHRLAFAYQFGLRFHKVLSPRAASLTQIQLKYCWAQNRQHPQPAHFFFTGCAPEAEFLVEFARKYLLGFDSNFIDVSPESYLNLFPKDQLIYLSPGAPEELLEFDSDRVYIIGAIVDKASGKISSFEKSQVEGIEARKLPLDRFVKWERGDKRLTLNSVLQMLLDANLHGDWKRAIRDSAPKRKISKDDHFCNRPVWELPTANASRLRREREAYMLSLIEQ